VVDVLEGGLAQTEVDLASPSAGIPAARPAGVSVVALWIMNSSSKEEQRPAWKFVKWLMEPEQQAECTRAAASCR